MDVEARYLKRHAEALVKDVGVERACDITGKSKATLGRYYSDAEENSERSIPVDAVAKLEAFSSYPHITAALAELRGFEISHTDEGNRSSGSGVNSDVVALSHRFAQLMREYSLSIEDGAISINEAKRMLHETLQLQRVLVEMKIHLEEEVSVP